MRNGLAAAEQSVAGGLPVDVTMDVSVMVLVAMVSVAGGECQSQHSYFEYCLGGFNAAW